MGDDKEENCDAISLKKKVLMKASYKFCTWILNFSSQNTLYIEQSVAIGCCFKYSYSNYNKTRPWGLKTIEHE
jgi:hypothetical protein